MANKYLRVIRPADGVGEPILVDVYEVILAFGVTCPARQHAIKKLLCAGLRGKGTTLQDLKEVIQSTQRAIEIVERNQEPDKQTNFEKSWEEILDEYRNRVGQPTSPSDSDIISDYMKSQSQLNPKVFETRSVELPVKLSPEMVEELKQDRERHAVREEQLNREWEQYCKEQEEKYKNLPEFGEIKAPPSTTREVPGFVIRPGVPKETPPFHPATCLHQRVTQYSNDSGTIEHCRDCGMVRNVEIKLPTKEQTNG